jgi:hypothetical protein
MLYRSSIAAIALAALSMTNGHLMPSKKDQPPPDLRYFKPSRK